MSDVINRSALSAMEDFLRAREADSTTEGVLAKVGYNLCYKEPCVIKNLYRQRTCWLQLEQEWLQGWGEGLCSTLVLQVRCKRKFFFFKKIILDECSTVFEMDQVRSRKAAWIGQMMAK